MFRLVAIWWPEVLDAFEQWFWVELLGRPWLGDRLVVMKIGLLCDE